MIATAHKIRRLSPEFRLNLSCTRNVVLCAVALIILSGCTNSKLVIGPLYNRFDDQMRGEFHKLGKWNDDQIAHFESRAGTYHVWHRQSELPKYADLLQTIQASIGKRGETSLDDVRSWIDEAEEFTQSARVCHPVNFSFDLIKTLTDKQVTFIERRFASERKKNWTKYSKLTAEQRQAERLNTIVKWAGRIGFRFTDKQTKLLDKALGDQISMRRQYYRLVDVWARDLFNIARKQDAPDYEQKMRAQVTKLWTLLENGHPQQWEQNRILWRQFGHDFVETLTHDQRVHTSRWLRKMGRTLKGISKDKPSFKVVNDPKYGCLVNNT